MFDNSDNNQQGSQFQQGPAPMPPTQMPPSYPLNPTPSLDIPMSPAPMSPVSQAQVPPVSTPPVVDGLGDDALMSIKQDALASLTPLVGQIQQSPEEKFKTTMMLIQASDNAALIKEAYATANQIKDEKARAQALIDVINEINYFTQKHEKNN